MSLLQETKNIQSQMALFCRTGRSVELPGLTPDRFHHYRRLIYNIVQENLESSFPIAFEYIAVEKWNSMVHHFFSEHNCQSYQVWQLAGEFYDFALSENFAVNYQIDYLNDLLKFEWEEMVVYNMEDVAADDYTESGDLLNDRLVLNPEYKLLQLQYPVHVLNPVMAAEQKGNYFVLVYREQSTGKVQFMDLSVWYALVIEQLAAQAVSVSDLIAEAPVLFGPINLNTLRETTLHFIETLRAKHFVLGFKKQ